MISGSCNLLVWLGGISRRFYFFQTGALSFGCRDAALSLEVHLRYT